MTGEDTAAASDRRRPLRNRHAGRPRLTPLQHFRLPLRLFRFVQIQIVFDFQNLTTHARRHIHLSTWVGERVRVSDCVIVQVHASVYVRRRNRRTEKRM